MDAELEKLRRLCGEQGITLSKAQRWSADAEEHIDDEVWLRWRLTMHRLPLNDESLADAVQHADFCRDVVTALSE
jgi:hypothetical protein